MAVTSICVCKLSPSCLFLLWKGCLVSASGSNLGFFQIIASTLGLGVCEILHVSLKVKSDFLQPSGLSQKQVCWPIKPNILGACLLVEDLLAGEPHRAQRDFFRRISGTEIILPFVCHFKTTYTPLHSSHKLVK